MINWQTYISSLGLQGLTYSFNYVYFRCPICGDSKTNSNKKSAYILDLDKEKPHFYCHRRNCTTEFGNSLLSLIRHIDHSLYLRALNELRDESIHKFGETYEKKTVIIEKKKSVDKTLNEFYKWMRPVSEMKRDSQSIKYLEKRRIGKIHHDRIFYFYGNPYVLFEKIFGDDKYLEKEFRKLSTHEGLIIPFINRDKIASGLGMRILNPKNDFRFINLFTHDNKEFFFGEDKVDWNKEVFILEGMFDKLSFDSDNQILAMLSTNQKLDYLNKLCKDNKKVTFIYDYEYMNHNIERSIGSSLKNGNKIFLWPDTIDSKSIKDINDIKIHKNMNDNDLISFIQKNTYTELEAKMILSQRRIMTEQRLIF